MSCERFYLWSHPTPWSDCTSREGYLWNFQMCLLHIYIQIKLYICTFRLIINFTKNLVISWDFHTFGELPTSGFQKKSCDFVPTIKQFLVLPWGRGSLIVWVYIVRREQYMYVFQIKHKQCPNLLQTKKCFSCFYHLCWTVDKAYKSICREKLRTPQFSAFYPF